MKTVEFAQLLKKHQMRFVSAVPDSAIQGIIETLEADPWFHYAPMNREDNLISWAAGLFLAGETPLVMMQNSGIGNMLDALISLQMTYRMPLVMLISWRGLEKKDEVQHWIWGEVQNPILDAVNLPYLILEQGVENIEDTFDAAVKLTHERKWPVAVLLRRGNYIDEKN